MHVLKDLGTILDLCHLPRVDEYKTKYEPEDMEKKHWRNCWQGTMI